MINILIVDDSETETTLLKTILEMETDMQVVACAKNGIEAVELAERYKPDLITMDIIMPLMDGFEATRVIMSENPRPIVVISSAANDEIIDTTFQALEAGALSVIEKPVNVTSPAFEEVRKDIIETIRSMADIRVISKHFPLINKRILRQKSENGDHDFEIIAMGASVGGTQALKTIFANLPNNFPVPIVVVQHMTKGFINGFSKWLGAELSIKVKTADANEPLEKGTIYLAPDDFHLEIIKVNNNLTTRLNKCGAVSGFCPSITALFDSVAKVTGKQSVGVLLTGMGSDGANGLLAIKNVHGLTIIQDEKSSVVFGMGAVAQSLGAVDKVVELDKMADFLKRLPFSKKNH